MAAVKVTCSECGTTTEFPGIGIFVCPNCEEIIEIMSEDPIDYTRTTLSGRKLYLDYLLHKYGPDAKVSDVVEQEMQK